MGLTAAALPIVWTAAGGRKDITTTLVATVFLLWVSQTLAVKGAQYALVLMGVILLVVVLLAPDGLVLLVSRGVGRMFRHKPAVATVDGHSGSSRGGGL
jgi:branched-chain amino acid transport system permease protein